MSYGNEILKVARLENGLEVEVYQPAPPKKGKAADKKADSCRPMEYGHEDPWKAYAFETDAAALAFITAQLPGLTRKDPKTEMEDTFNEVTK